MLSLSRNPLVYSRSVNRQKNLSGIDLMKFLCAVLVFMIHIPPCQGDLTMLEKTVNFGLQHCICRVAVPFYFACSGFFLFRKMPADRLDTDIIKEYCYKILRLLGIWSVLLFTGGTKHLWYMGATVIAILLVCLCCRLRINRKLVWAVAIFLYIVGLLGDSYYGLIAPLKSSTIINYIFKGYALFFNTTRNGVFMGFIFVLMGASFSRREMVLKPLLSLAGFLVSMAALAAEAYLLETHKIPLEYNMYVFLLPAVYFLFSLAYAIALKERPIYRRLRSIGMLVYFSHLFVNTFVSLFIRMLAKYWHVSIGEYQFVISLSITLCLAICVEWLSRKDKFKWINWALP